MNNVRKSIRNLFVAGILTGASIGFTACDTGTNREATGQEADPETGIGVGGTGTATSPSVDPELGQPGTATDTTRMDTTRPGNSPESNEIIR
jgi:hypothetical protein